MTSESRTSNEMKDTMVYQAIDYLIWDNHELSTNSWMIYWTGVIENIEDKVWNASGIFQDKHPRTQNSQAVLHHREEEMTENETNKGFRIIYDLLVKSGGINLGNRRSTFLTCTALTRN